MTGGAAGAAGKAATDGGEAVENLALRKEMYISVVEAIDAKKHPDKVPQSFNLTVANVTGDAEISQAHHKVEALGDERFRFKTRAVFQTAKPTADFISDWGTANCKNQTLYGKPAPKIAEFGYQSGSPQLYAAICGEKP